MDQQRPWPHTLKKQGKRSFGSALWPLAEAYGDPRYHALLKTEVTEEIEWLWWPPAQRPGR